MIALRKLLGLLIFIQLAVFLQAQNFLTDPGAIKYFPGAAEPSSNWKAKNFNDNSWFNGGGIIGYGDTCDVKINNVQSLYTRSYFNVTDVASLQEMVLICDFDDGFVAYINGVEFARVNMGKFGSITTYNQLSDKSREKEFYIWKQYQSFGYYIGKEFIENNVKNGQNVLSIEVHNDSINGSDLGVIGFLVDRTNIVYNIYDFYSRYKKCVELDSTKLPIIVIESDEYGIPYKRISVPANIGIIDNGIGKYNKPGDFYNVHSGPITIEVRGESSSGFPKRSYDFDLKDSDGKDTSVSLLGLPKESDWVLQGPWADKSQIRNTLIYEMGRKTGHWTPRTKFCEVILNGEFVGLYNLIEKIKRDSSRINIGKLQPTEISGIDLTGGYILKYDKPGGLQIVYPKAADLQPEQKQYILDYMKEYQAVLKTNSGLDEVEGYKKYIDENSLIDYAIIAELAKNCDSYLFSSYLYKDKADRDNRFLFGPLWDFDLCFGNSIWQEGYQTDEWQFDYPSNNEFRIKRLFQDTALVNKFKARWFELRAGFLHTDSIFDRIDALTVELQEPLARNYNVWPVIDRDVFFQAYSVSSYENEIETAKNWITQRVAWMDENINNIYYPVTIYTDIAQNPANDEDQFNATIFPNPFSQDFYIDINMPFSGNLKVEIIDVQGKEVGIIDDAFIEKGDYKVYWNKGNENLFPGLYLVSIKIDGKTYQHLKALYINN